MIAGQKLLWKAYKTPTASPVLTKVMTAAHFMGSEITYVGSHPIFYSSMSFMENLLCSDPPCYLKQPYV